MSYESIKSYEREHRQSFITAGLCIAIFGIGYGTGSSWHATSSKSNAPLPIKQNNYTTKPASLPPPAQTAEGEPAAGVVTPEVKGAQSSEVIPKVTPTASATTSGSTAKPSTSSDCLVKGNVSKDSKIYHVLGGSFYNRVKPEQCFQTEAEAQAAGFRKSTR